MGIAKLILVNRVVLITYYEISPNESAVTVVSKRPVNTAGIGPVFYYSIF